VRRRTFKRGRATIASCDPVSKRARIEGMPQLRIYVSDDETSSHAAFDILQDAAGEAVTAWLGAHAHGGRPAQRQITVVDATIVMVTRADGQAGIAIAHKTERFGMPALDRGRGWVDSGVLDRKISSQMFSYLTEWLASI
jgi:hypothetical protein